MKLPKYLFIASILWGLAGCVFPLNGADLPGYPRFMQGPMVGAVTPSEIIIWGRLSGPFRGEIEFATTNTFDDSRSLAMTASKDEDYVLKWHLTGLEPDTRYYYRFKVKGNTPRYQQGVPPFYTKTAPVEGERLRFTVAFGSCVRILHDREQKIWPTLHRFQPDVFFWLGDNIYGDSLDMDIIAEEWKRQRDVASLQPVNHSIPQLATWDDHDFGLNNYDRRHPMKTETLKLFNRFWANPPSGLPDAPGVFFKYRYGGVDFFFLDVRYHRDPNKEPDHPGKTMLGKEQFEWLQNSLSVSDSPFKVLISGSGWTNSKGPKGDAWSAFLHERNRLFEFIRKNEINGVILLSGDTHVGELNAIPWSEKGGYDFYDLVSSPLAQTANEPRYGRIPELRIRPNFTREDNFGLLQFDLTGDPVLRFNLIGVSGREGWAPFVIHASELVNGVSSWKDKISKGLPETIHW